MNIIRKYISLILVFTLFISLANAAVVKVFDVGQGNCVAVKHERKVLIIDAGSSERAFSSAYEAASHQGKKFIIQTETPVHGGDAAAAAEPDLSSYSPGAYEQSPTSQESFCASQKQEASQKQGVKKRSNDQLLQKIKTFITDEVDHIVVMTTHADADHVNWIPKIFGKDVLEKLQGVIFGGFSVDYDTRVLGKWICSVNQKGVPIIYTGTYDGKEGYPSILSTPCPPEGDAGGKEDDDAVPIDGIKGQEPASKRLCTMPQHSSAADVSFADVSFARYYRSGILPRTKTEEEISQLLWFDNSLHVKILSMNGGIYESTPRPSSGQSFMFRGNTDANANSLVVAICDTVSGKSFLVPGDADETTWSRMAAERFFFPVTYMLLSHHGSKEHGATSNSLLELFQPQVLIISAGQHQSYHHPSEDVINICCRYFRKNRKTLGFVEPHTVTYFKPEAGKSDGYSYQRRLTQAPLFSTVTQGTLTLDLGIPSTQVHASRDKSRLFVDPTLNQRFLACGYEIVDSEAEAKAFIQANTSGTSILFTEAEPQGGADEQAADDHDEEDSQQNEKLLIKRESIDKPEAAKAGAAMDTSDDSITYYVLRKKADRDGPILLLYRVSPYEPDKSADA